jgi:hypothetical protein
MKLSLKLQVSVSVYKTHLHVSSQIFRYSDGDLTLVYFGGDECSSGFQRMSIINFECNKTAGEHWVSTPALSVGQRGVCVSLSLNGAVRYPPLDLATSSPQTGFFYWSNIPFLCSPTHTSCFRFLLLCVFVLGTGPALVC